MVAPGIPSPRPPSVALTPFFSSSDSQPAHAHHRKLRPREAPPGHRENRCDVTYVPWDVTLTQRGT
eukprot:1852314-Rhodomonas_salina.1